MGITAGSEMGLENDASIPVHVHVMASPCFMRPTIISLLRGGPTSLSTVRRRGRAEARVAEWMSCSYAVLVIEEEAGYLGELVVTQRMENDDLVA